MRELSFGGYHGTMWRWTFQTGNCWAAVGFGCQPPPAGYLPSDMVGWACWTEEDEPHPVVGTYVDKTKRKYGYGSQLSRSLLDSRKVRRHPGSIVYAVAANWPSWPALIQEAGFTFAPWE